jgi:spermidine synthase
MRRLLSAILLVSMTAIAYEILLMRMLSIVQWHHFAWMVISLALLGYGASGTAIALARQRLGGRFETAFAACALLFSITMALSWGLAQRIPFNAYEVAWDQKQVLYLGALYLVCMPPFFFAASCIGLAFSFRAAEAARIYRFDLLGAAAGAAGIIAALFLGSPQQVLVLLCLLGVAASVLAGGKGPALHAGQSICALAVLLALPLGLLDLRMSEFKGQSQALQVVGSHTLETRSGPLGQVAVIESPQVPIRHAPGMSIAARHIPPEQLAVFVDGDGLSALNRWDGTAESLAYLGDTTSALPYQLLDAPRVLVLGAGTGTDALQALYHGASAVEAVELNPQIVGLVRNRFGDWSGGVYDHPQVETHIAEARSFTKHSTGGYDLVVVSLLDSFAVAGSGVQALNESYLYTVEALRGYLGLLRPGGCLAMTRWLKIPPRDSFKLIATASEALSAEGIHGPGAHMALIRGWNTVTFLIRNGAMGEEDIEAIRSFVRSRSFDPVYFPGMMAQEANRYNRLDRAWFHEGIAAILAPNAKAFISDYKFDIRPATDDRPYFFDFFRWVALPEVLALRERGGAALLEWGYLVPAATLVQAGIAGAVLILLPLAVFTRRQNIRCDFPARSYFFLLGLAFMLVEIAYIQKFTLFLGHPLYAVAVVLAGFLVFAGLGSGLSNRLAGQATARRLLSVPLAVGAIVLIVLLHLAILPGLFRACIGLPDMARAAVALLAIAPLALFMGMPFPLGMSRLSRAAPDFVPWAWGINGFASVLSAALATLLAIQFGFSAVLLLALGLYIAAAACFRRGSERPALTTA